MTVFSTSYFTSSNDLLQDNKQLLRIFWEETDIFISQK